MAAQSWISSEAVLGPEVEVGPGAVLEKCRIGRGTRVGACAYVGPGVVIGEDCELGAQCVIMEGAVLGDRCRVSPGAVIGSRGYGFVEDGGVHVPIPQVGGVEIGSDCVIGVGTCVDRGTVKPTRIGARTKLGAQVQVAHNCQIGEDSILEDQTGLSGSCILGRSCHLQVQSGLAGHASMGDYSVLGVRAGLTRRSPAHSDLWGFPARPRREAMRAAAALAKLAAELDDVEKDGADS